MSESSPDDFQSASVITPLRSSLGKIDTPPLQSDSSSGQEIHAPCASGLGVQQQILADAQLAVVLQEWEDTGYVFEEITTSNFSDTYDRSKLNCKNYIRKSRSHGRSFSCFSLLCTTQNTVVGSPRNHSSIMSYTRERTRTHLFAVVRTRLQNCNPISTTIG